LNGRNVDGCVRAAVLTGDGGHSGATIEFDEGEAIAVLRTVSGGRQEEGRARGRIGVVRGRVGRGDGRKASGDGSDTLLKGGGGNAAEGGGKSGDAWRVELGRERGPGRGEK
jgi:hypothetical protein